MDCSASQAKQQELFARIIEFVAQTSGLRGEQISDQSIRIEQSSDSKSIVVRQNELDDVLFRSDTEGQDFIQVNFSSGKKLLITDRLVGFKPATLQGLEASKLPRVVTTPDIVSVFEAIQEALHASDGGSSEVLVLKKVFEAVILGGESVGFDLTQERSWIKRIPTAVAKVSA